MLILGKSAKHLQNALAKSGLARQLGGAILAQETLKNIEEAFIEADLGYQCAKEIVAKLAGRKFKDPSSLGELQLYLRELITQKLIKCQVEKKIHEAKIAIHDGLLVIVLLGLNGAGKTSSAGKLAARFQKRGEKTILVAGDTFRAAATEQISIWAQKANVPIIAEPTSDPAALAYRALEKAREDNASKLIIDTAGRLDSDANLMQQLAKMERALTKQKNSGKKNSTESSQENSTEKNKKENPSFENNPSKKNNSSLKNNSSKKNNIAIQFWLVLDATLGQNLKTQVKRFAEHVKISGLLITKIDSSAKAGALVALAQENSLPIYFVTNGEKITDLVPFDAKVFAEKLIQIDKQIDVL